MNDRPPFDHEGFYDALNTVRDEHRVTWRQVAKEARVSQSTLTRLAQGKRPDVDSLAALVAWAGLDANKFVTRNRVNEDARPLAMISTYLRGDRHLTPEAADALQKVVVATYTALASPEPLWTDEDQTA